MRFPPRGVLSKLWPGRGDPFRGRRPQDGSTGGANLRGAVVRTRGSTPNIGGCPWGPYAGRLRSYLDGTRIGHRRRRQQHAPTRWLDRRDLGARPIGGQGLLEPSRGNRALIFGAKIAGEQGQPFLRTGDLGFIYDGELFVTGRSKEILIVRGRNYYPHDIEATVQSCNPALRSGGGAAFEVQGEGGTRIVIVQELDRKLGRGADLRSSRATSVKSWPRFMRCRCTISFFSSRAACPERRAARFEDTLAGKVMRRATLGFGEPNEPFGRGNSRLAESARQ